MATAAPVAPPSAPPDAGAPQLEAAQPVQRIRPIPSRKPTQKGLGLPGVGKPPMLPGVVDTVDPDTGVELGAEAPEAAPELPTDQPVEQLGEVEQPADQPWLDLDLGDGVKAKFRDEQHLAQNLKTLRGQFRSMQQNEVAANEKAYGWHQQAVRFETMLRTLGVDPETGAFSQPGTAQGASPQAAPPDPTQLTPADVEKELTESVDWKVLNNLLRQDPMQALAYQQMENAKAVSRFIAEKIPALIDARIAPLAEQAQRAQGMTAVSSFWSQARGARDSNGNPVFPELQTNQGLQEMGQVWTELHAKHGLPLEFLMTPEGIHTAALWYRQFKNQNGGAATPPTAQHNPAQIASQVRGAIDARTGGNALAPGARASVPAANARPVDPKRALAAAIRSAGPSQDLGVRFDD